MRIGLVCSGYPPADGGGIGSYTKTLAGGIVERGHEVVVLTTSEGADSEYVDDGVIICRVDVSKYVPMLEKILPGISASYRVYRVLRRLQEEKPFDVVEFPNWEALGVVSQLLMPWLPCCVRVHTPYFETLEFDKGEAITWRDKVICAQEKWSCKKAAQLVSSTKSHASLVAERYSLSVSEFSILPLGIKDRYSRQLLEEKLNRKRDQFKILYVSRLENRKGTLLLLDALPTILKSRPDIHVDFVGKDRPHAPGNIYFSDYFAQRFEVFSSQVSFHGYLGDEVLDELYREADLFVVPSQYESFGLIYAEALMFGLPCIATDGGGIGEVVSDGLDGVLLKQGTLEEIAAAVDEFHSDFEKIRVTSLVARSSFEQRFQDHLLIENSLELYKNIDSKFAR